MSSEDEYENTAEQIEESQVLSEENLLKILVATDCHLGFAEKDPIRQDDSFNTFEEILKMAHQHEVDMILLGGDLFHDNKPSRNTIHQTISLLRKYCLGDKECEVEFLSDPQENFAHCDFKHANYADPNINVAYPVFSVHGNHDDPTGENFLSAIDILSTAGLLNHFGKAKSCDDIEISPVLLKKGITQLALYGLGAMRDERLHKTFCCKKVKMLRPKEDADNWLNVLVLHQNRAKHGPKNYIPESFLDDFLDLVIWGHEHECLIEPTWSESAKQFFVSQPGSSIATSLSEGESKDKHVGLLEIHEKKFRMKKLRLETVRQFLIDNVTLSESGIDSHDEDKIVSYLSQKVEDMIEEAQSKHTGNQKQPTLPLIRIKVEYSGGYEVINPHRFGQQFVDRVANNKDLLLFYRKRINTSFHDGKKVFDEPELHFSQPNTVRMEDLINQYLNETDKKLQLSILSERKLSKALNEFVLKDEKEAIPELVKWQLRKTQETLCNRKLDQTRLDEAIVEVKASREQVTDAEENKEIEELLASARNRTSVDDGDGFSDIDMDLDDDDMAQSIAPSKRGRRGRGRAKSTTQSSKPATQRGRGGRGRGGRGRASKVDTTQRSVAESFISTGRKTTKRDEMNDGVDGSPYPKRTQTQRRGFSGIMADEPIKLSDDDDDDNPFEFEKPKKRVRR